MKEKTHEKSKTIFEESGVKENMGLSALVLAGRRGDG